jgi:hypothetical protein
VTAATTFTPMLLGSIAKWPSTKVPPWASVSAKRVVTPVPSQKIETSWQPSSRSIMSSCSSALNGPFTTPR